jgi:pimeloyl-ACP methyl ester carboxylesterase
MLHVTTLLVSLTIGGGAPAVESVCQQVVPMIKEGAWKRTPDQRRAVVLMHGYHFHVWDKNVGKAVLRPWQTADANLCKELGKSADVFVFGYGQNATIDGIVKDTKLAQNVAQLRKLGYTEIVLVGHSAGGLIARHFVEDFPDAGVTRVVQICAPNGGSPFAKTPAPKSQQAFLACLTEKGREQCLIERATKQIPAKIDFVCVIARREIGADTDGLVPCRSQWTADLQKQGVPAVCVTIDHHQIVRDGKAATTLADVICSPQPRWSSDRVERARKEIFGGE